MRTAHPIRVLTLGAVVAGLLAGPAIAGSDDNHGCPSGGGWALQSVAGSTPGHDRWDRNGDGRICSKGNETLPGNAGPPNGQGNTASGSAGTSGHVHKDNNNPS